MTPLHTVPQYQSDSSADALRDIQYTSGLRKLAIGANNIEQVIISKHINDIVIKMGRGIPPHTIIKSLIHSLILSHLNYWPVIW